MEKKVFGLLPPYMKDPKNQWPLPTEPGFWRDCFPGNNKIEEIEDIIPYLTHQVIRLAGNHEVARLLLDARQMLSDDSVAVKNMTHPEILQAINDSDLHDHTIMKHVLADSLHILLLMKAGIGPKEMASIRKELEAADSQPGSDLSYDERKGELFQHRLVRKALGQEVVVSAINSWSKEMRTLAWYGFWCGDIDKAVITDLLMEIGLQIPDVL